MASKFWILRKLGSAAPGVDLVGGVRLICTRISERGVCVCVCWGGGGGGS